MTHIPGAHIIITGGSEGIGAEFARLARTQGARVSLIARREGPLQAVAREIGAEHVAADVTDEEAISEAVRRLECLQGPCDILVTAAGIALPGRFTDTPLRDAETEWRVNVLGTMAAVRAVVPGMIARNRGHIVTVSSTAGLIGVVGYTGYTPTKWAVRGFSQALRYEVEPHGVRVSVLYPPDTKTPGFARENTRKPPETAAVSGAITPVPAERVAVALARGIERDRASITADALTRILIGFGPAFETLARPTLNRHIRRAVANSTS
ncbi:MAG TPA: SDR family oxidoreductase [Pseudoclavibacter sp.]|nr:SDR family oxidoreductase [Pseudoclavibacter sp.]